VGVITLDMSTTLTSKRMNIGIIDVGKIGGTLARKLIPSVNYCCADP